MLIEITVDEIDGVSSVKSDHATGVTTVEYDQASVSLETLTDAIRSAGYGAETVE
jgi:Cu+-exporting ATPase